MKTARKFFNYCLEFESFDEQKAKVPKAGGERTDNNRLLELQYDFLVNGNEKSFALLWIEFAKLCKKIVDKETRLKRFFLDFEEKEYKAQIAAEYVLRRYAIYKNEKNKLYFVENFIATAFHAVRHALYSEGENDFFLEQCKKLNGKKVDLTQDYQE